LRNGKSGPSAFASPPLCHALYNERVTEREGELEAEIKRLQDLFISQAAHELITVSRLAENLRWRHHQAREAVDDFLYREEERKAAPA
jgi:hypothetical protein